ncbi:MAG: hypothetical protein E2O39_11035 [Planctomycetota bacterium]|nr:MAG: hypothetical protein E2O39_11035 [Planctomycetota bacterium]
MAAERTLRPGTRSRPDRTRQPSSMNDVESTKSPLRKLARTGVIAAALLLASLLAAEAVLRVRANRSPRYYTNAPGVVATYHPDPERMPGVSGPSTVAFDARGLRGHDPGPDATYGILAVGGSTTACDYLDQPEAWPALLEARLGPPAWVGNAGRSGLTSREHVLQLRHLLPQLPEVRLVVCLVGVNDLALRLQRGADYDPRFMDRPGERARSLDRAFFERPRTYSFAHLRSTAVFGLLDRLRRRRWAAEGASEEALGRVYEERRRMRRAAALVLTELPELDSALGEYARNLRAMIAIAREHDVRIVFVTQPALWRVDLPEELRALLWFGWKDREPASGATEYYSVQALAAGMAAYNRTLLATCAAENVECIDLASVLPRDERVFYDDCHFNEHGARLAADVIGEQLSQSSPFGRDR